MSGAVILIADDDEADAMFLRRALLEACPGLRVIDVPDGQEAIDYFEGRGRFADRANFPLPTHLFLDVKMPRRSGLEVLRWLREQKELGALSVTVLSGSQLPGDRNEAESLDAEYIVKPVEYAALVEIARQFCRKWGL